MKLRAYPEYKASDVEWLGDVPKHWVTWKITHGFKTVGSGATPNSDDSQYYDGEIPWVTTSELRETQITRTKQRITQEAVQDYSSLRLYPEGTVLFAMYGATIGRLGILGVPATVNQACCAFSEPTTFESKFVYYWLWMRRPILISLSSGGGQPNLSQDDLRGLRIPAPERREQICIATFLDEHTAKLDALIEKKQALVEKLQEKRSALISRTVTRGLPPEAARAAGLDPDPKMKASGISWLGEIQEHWEAVQLRRRWLVLDCKHKTVSFVNNGIPLASIQEVHSFEVDLSEAKQTTEDEYEEMIDGGRKPKIGDIIYSRNATVGDAAIVTTSKPFCMGQDVCLIRSVHQFARFAIYALRSRPLIEQAEALMIGSTFRRINVGQIKGFWIALPGFEEQKAIAKYLDRETLRIDRMIANVKTAVEKLTEYRSALITAAVTGKIDVRSYSGD